MTPTVFQAGEAATALDLDTHDLATALRNYAEAAMDRAAEQFRKYDKEYGATISLARRFDRAATACFEAWEQETRARVEPVT